MVFSNDEHLILLKRRNLEIYERYSFLIIAESNLKFENYFNVPLHIFLFNIEKKSNARKHS